MKSPMQRQRLKKLAQTQDTDTTSNEPVGTAYEQMLMQLKQHQKEISACQSNKAKAKLKMQFLPEYTDYIDSILEAGTGAQDEVLVTCMIWYADTKDLSHVIPLARYALHNDLVMPERFNRSIASFLAEDIAEIVQDEAAEYKDELLEIEKLTNTEDMHDQVRAKLYKTIGLSLKDSDKVNAIEYFSKAYEFNKNCGVKQFINSLNKELQKESQDDSLTEPSTEQQSGQVSELEQ